MYGVAAYVLWGLFPLYFHLLDGFNPILIVAHRIIWAFVFLAIIMTIVRGWTAFRQGFTRRTAVWLTAAAAFLAVNWSVYVYAVTSDHVVEASLGYFINPLVTVLMAVIVLRERLSPVQWLAVGMAGVGVLVITFSSGALPWIGLALAITFGTYGLIRKKLSFKSLDGLTIETATLLPVALLVLLWYHPEQTGTATSWTAILFVLLGPVTAVPLLAFGAAASRLPLATLGMLQYICPTIVFLLGILLYQEPMAAGEWVGFVLIWAALALLSYAMVHQSRRAGSELEPALD